MFRTPFIAIVLISLEKIGMLSHYGIYKYTLNSFNMFKKPVATHVKITYSCIKE